MRPAPRSSPNAAPPPPPAGRPWYLWLLVIGGLAVVLLALRPRRGATTVDTGSSDSAGRGAGTFAAPAGSARDRAIGGLRRTRTAQDGGQPPEAVVATRVGTFAQARREIAHELARRGNVELPADFDRFFDAVQSGNWSDIKGLYGTLSALRSSPDTAKSLEAVWPAVVEAYGAATVATSWPANELLAYGESVNASLRPGTVYLSGTEAGRFIPALLGDRGSAGAMVLTPDSLADPAQVEYLALAYPDRFGGINREDIDRILRRDQPAADGQSAPGLDPKSARAEILRALIERNPGLTFAVDGSFNLGELAADVVPSGPVLEIRPGAGRGGTSMPAARAGDTAEYWRATAQRLASESSLEPESFTRREYAQMALIQGRVLEDQNLGAEAEQTYRAAQQMSPVSFEPLERLSLYLASHGRMNEATELLEEHVRQNPGHATIIGDLRKRLAPAAAPQ